MNDKTNSATGGIDYCFWAKLFIGIPAVAIIAVIGASLFENQILSGMAAVFFPWLAIVTARKIDSLPSLQGKVFSRKK